jgi:hypothetical protein
VELVARVDRSPVDVDEAERVEQERAERERLAARQRLAALPRRRREQPVAASGLQLAAADDD